MTRKRNLSLRSQRVSAGFVLQTHSSIFMLNTVWKSIGKPRKELGYERIYKNGKYDKKIWRSICK